MRWAGASRTRQTHLTWSRPSRLPLACSTVSCHACATANGTGTGTDASRASTGVRRRRLRLRLRRLQIIRRLLMKEVEAGEDTIRSATPGPASTHLRSRACSTCPPTLPSPFSAQQPLGALRGRRVGPGGRARARARARLRLNQRDRRCGVSIRPSGQLGSLMIKFLCTLPRTPLQYMK